MNPTEVVPPATVTLAGTVALGLLLASATAIPGLGAALVRVTVQATLPGAVTVDGAHVTLPGTTAAAVRFTTALTVAPFTEALNPAL